MHVPLADLKAQYTSIRSEIEQAIFTTLENTSFISGPAVAQFEEAFAEYLGVAHAVGCGNGTDSLEILLQAMDIGPGDEVIVPAMSWISTSEVVVTAGATPVFVDVDPDTFTIDPTLIAAKITDRTRAIIPVHLYGHPADMPAIMAIAEQHNLRVIEDCAQAHGAAIRGQKAGTWGHAASFSFFPSKNLGAYGDAGAMVTNDAALALRVRQIARHGQERRHHHILHGRNSRLDTLQAAILLAKLPYLEQWTDQRIRWADYYQEQLGDQAPLACPIIRPDYRHVFHLYVIRHPDRDNLRKYLTEQDVQTGIHYPTALPFHPCYEYLQPRAEDFPVAHSYQSQILSIPMYAELPAEAAQYVVETICRY